MPSEPAEGHTRLCESSHAVSRGRQSHLGDHVQVELHEVEPKRMVRRNTIFTSDANRCEPLQFPSKDWEDGGVVDRTGRLWKYRAVRHEVDEARTELHNGE